MEKSNKIHVWIYSILILALIGAIIWAFTLRSSAKTLKIDRENQYNRAFHEMVGYIDDIDTLLSKAQLTNSPAELATLSSDIFRQSAEAKSCLGELPTSEVQLENTSKFLSQVGDYTYVLSQDMINGEQITEEEYKNLNSLNEYAANLKSTLVDIQTKIYNGELSFSDPEVKSTLMSAEAADGSIFEDLENVEKSFDEYPSLIYDGPFSEHIENQQSVMLAEQPEISQEEALNKAKDFLGSRADGLEFTGETANTAINAYNFSKSTDNGQLAISITKNGGYTLYFLESREIGEENYDVSAATEEAIKFLERHGFEDMVSSYYETTNGVATINFAWSQDGVICYSDLIKVRVALDTGEIIGMEAKGYLMNHKHRELPQPSLDENEAHDRISTNLDVSSTNLVVIPKDSLKEVFCYEFKGVFHDKNFIVYVNAENGREEEILLLLESETGILTI